MTTSEYRKKLFQMDNFACRPYRKRKWESDEIVDIPLEKAENYQITDPRLKRESKRIKKPKPEEHREERDQVQATIQKAVISKFPEKCETINIEDLLVIEVPTKATTSTIGPVMFKVIEDTFNKSPPRSTHNFKVQQEEMQKSVITPFEETIEAQGTDENFNITPIGSTSGEEENMVILHGDTQ